MHAPEWKAVLRIERWNKKEGARTKENLVLKVKGSSEREARSNLNKSLGEQSGTPRLLKTISFECLDPRALMRFR